MTNSPSTREAADCICVTRGTGPEGCGLCNETGKLQKMQTGPDHAELARLAEAATQGVWNRYVSGAPEYNNVTHGLEVGEMGPLICGAFEREDDCRFVEAVQPSVVLSLLSEIAALRDYGRDVAKEALEYRRQRDEAVEHLKAMSHVAPRTFEVEAALAFLANQGADQ